MIGIASLLWHYKKQVRQSESALLHHLFAQEGIPVHDHNVVIRIDYAQPAYKVLDEWLSSRADSGPATFVILLTAPGWLCQIKRKSWDARAWIVDASACHPVWHALLSSPYTVFELIGNQRRYYTDQQLFLEQTRQEAIAVS
ncbi:hypothetical protein [Paenibacillus methanolicus]|nr:hypothetical protein [Paenibacillus methanolicus]